MTALKINRFSLSEIEDVTIRCKKCDAGHIVKIDSEQFRASKCPSCGLSFGEISFQAFEHIQNASYASRMGSEHFDIEFNIVEK